MPPRKSTSSVTPADPDADTESSPQGTPQSQVQIQVPIHGRSQSQSQSQGHITATEQQIKARAESGVNVDDHLLPRSLTIRLAKSVLPPNTTIQKDAVLAIQKAATVFVSYLSSHANEATLKRTVAPADVLSAISELEFDGFRERLEQELDAYTEIKAGKRKKTGPGAGGETTGDNAKGKDGEEEEEDTARDVKRVKRGGAGKDTDKGGAGAAEDGDETQDEPENEEDDDVEEEEDDNEGEGEGDEEDEEEEEEQEDGPDDDDINRVKDLDGESRPGGTMDPDADEDESDSEDETGPGSQLREDLGQG